MTARPVRAYKAIHARTALFRPASAPGCACCARSSRSLRSQGAGPIWSRYDQIGTDKPIFGDRDKTIHDDVNEISRERRNGYSWFNSEGIAVLNEYKTWAPAHPK